MLPIYDFEPVGGLLPVPVLEVEVEEIDVDFQGGVVAAMTTGGRGWTGGGSWAGYDGGGGFLIILMLVVRLIVFELVLVSLFLAGWRCGVALGAPTDTPADIIDHGDRPPVRNVALEATLQDTFRATTDILWTFVLAI
jgi:hypothetical protein